MLRKRTPLTGVEWADKYFRLPEGSSQISGHWVTQPLQVALLNMMTNDAIRELDVQKSARLGYTKCLVAAILYFVEHKRRSSVIYQPTDGNAKDFVIDELDSVIAEMPIIKKIFPDWGSENKHNTVKKKKGLGWIIDILGACTPANFRRLTKQVVAGDEVDGWPLESGKEGDPIKAALTRIQGATFPKAIFGTTPTVKGVSHIQRLMDSASETFRFYLPCPHCQHEQTLKWGGKDSKFGMRWKKNKTPDELTTADVWYQCEACSGKIFYSDLPKIETGARWIGDKKGTWTRDGLSFFSRAGVSVPAPRKCGIYVNALYSLTLTDGWVGLVREWLDAFGDPLKLKAFINLVLGELWEDETGEKLDSELLYARREIFNSAVPMGGLYATCFIDTQDDRFEGMVTVWGLGEESWTVDYFVLYGNLHKSEIWDQLEQRIKTARYRHEGGFDLTIRRFGIDTGGHFTDEAHAFVKRFPEHYGIACRGDTQYNQPVVRYEKRKNKHGTRPCVIGTDTAKDTIYGRYKLLPEPDENGQMPVAGAPCPGRVHWPVAEWCTREFFSQATAEVKKLGYSKGKKIYKYETRTAGARNEVLDTYVGNLAMLRLSQLYFGLNLPALKKSFDEIIQAGSVVPSAASVKVKKRKKVTGGL